MRFELKHFAVSVIGNDSLWTPVMSVLEATVELVNWTLAYEQAESFVPALQA